MELLSSSPFRSVPGAYSMSGIAFGARHPHGEQDPVSVPGKVVGSSRRGFGEQRRKTVSPTRRFRKSRVFS